VAFFQDSKEILCNTCIYERKLQGLKFSAIVTKDLKSKFDDSYKQYLAGLGKVGEINPQLAKDSLKTTANDFFKKLSEQVHQLRSSVLEKIKRSQSLKELELILSSSKEFLQEGSH